MNENDKNYYMSELIGLSGIGEVKNPLYISNNYNPFEYTPRRLFVGLYFNTDSKYDETLGDIEGAIQEGLIVDDLRARKLSGLDMAANALVNNLVIAGTEAVSGTIGFVDGIFEAAATGEIDKLWNNDITNWAVDTLDAVREAMPIYRGKEYEDKSIWGKMGTGIFWADLFLNLGYTEGMLIPGMGVSKLLLSAPRLLRAGLASFISTLGESADEAVREKNDEITNKTKIANLRYNELAENTLSPIGLSLLDLQYREDINNIEEDAINAGNFVYGSNIALLTMTNTIEFGNLFSRGFNTAMRMKGITKRAGRLILKESTGLAMTLAVGKKLLNAFSEGFEEVSQAVISRTPSEFEGLNRFNESMFNPEARELATSLWQALGQSYAETMNDPNTLVEFASGFLTGALGVPVLRKSKFPIGIENNMFLDIRDTYKLHLKRNQWIDSINDRLSSDKKIEAYYNGLVRRLVNLGIKNTALEREDAFDYKTAESEGFISDAIMFDDAGLLDYLRSIINDSIDMSDEGIDAIIEETSKNGNGPFMFNGNKMSRDEVREILKNNINLLNSKLESYILDKRSLESLFPNMSEEGLKAALYLKLLLRDFSTRYDNMAEELVNKVNLLMDELYKNNPSKEYKHKDKNLFILEWSVVPTFRKEVFEALNNKKSKFTYDERKDIGTKLNDLSRLNNSIGIYRLALDTIIKNPSKADSLAAESAKKALDKYKDNLVNEIVNLLNQAKSPLEIESILDSLDDNLKPYALDALNAVIESNDDQLKTKVKTYKDFKDLANNLQRAINRIPNEEAALKLSITNFVNDALQNSNTVEEVMTVLNDHLEKLKDLKNLEGADEAVKTLKSVIDYVSRASEAKKATEEDPKEPKKKIKNKVKEEEEKEKEEEPDKNKSKKKGFSISGLADTEDEAAEDARRTLEEGEEESKTKDKKEKDKSSKDTSTTKDKTLEEVLSEKTIELLLDIASGKVVLNFKKTPNSKVKELAKTMLLLKGTFEVKEGDEAEGGSTESIPILDEPALRSWAVTRYSFNELKERGVRSAKKYESEKADALEELGVYEFVDSGALGVLFNANPNIPIHYVASLDSRLEDTIILAIEVTLEVEKELKANGLKVISTFTGQDGKTYQAVGSLGYNAKDKTALYSYNKIKSLIASEIKRATKDKSLPQFFVSLKYSNRVKHLYSGRMVKSIDGSPIKQRPLQDIARETPILGVYYNSTLRVPMLSDYDEIVPLNTKNSNARNGSVWVISREADGRYYAKAVKVKRFTKKEFNLEENADSWIVRLILDDISILVDPNMSDEDRYTAKYDLMSLIYIPESNNIWFEGDEIRIKGYKNNIGKGLAVEEKAEAFLEALMDEKLNFRFLVIPSKLGDSNYVERLLEAGILTTDLALLLNVNASFDLFLPDKKGVIPESTVKKPKGHIGRKGVNNTTKVQSITLNGITYNIVDDVVKDDNGKTITDLEKLQEINFFMSVLNRPDYSPNTIYLSNYIDGTKFGIYNSLIYTGKKLEEMLSKEEKKAKTKKKEDNAKEMNDKEKDSLFEEVDTDLEEDTKDTTESTELASSDETDKWFESSDLQDIETSTEEESEGTEAWFKLVDETKKEGTSSTEQTEPKKKKGLIIDEDFDEGTALVTPKSDDEITTIKKFAKKRDYLSQIVLLGFKKVSDFVDYLNENSDKYPEVITSEEQFKALLEKIKNCR